MTRKRQRSFLDAVSCAARDNKPLRARGRPTQQNLTSEGRTLGLTAMQASPRCRSRRRDGLACKAPALKGATRCLKHGGRVEVPAHPHNIKRFFSGATRRERSVHNNLDTDNGHWDALSAAEKRELASIVSERVLRSPDMLNEAAKIWMRIKDMPFPYYKRFLSLFARA